MAAVGKVSSGGVIIESIVDEAYKRLKMGKKVTNRWIIFKMDEAHSKITVETEGGLDASMQNGDEKQKRKQTHEKFVKLLPQDDCRFAVVDCDKTIYFILWTPESASVKQKMIYTSSKETLKSKLPGCDGTSIEAHEYGDFDKLL